MTNDPLGVLLRVRAALTTASHASPEGDSSGEIHRNRSKTFVLALTQELRLHWNSDVKSRIRVLSRECDKHRQEFGLNELLYDFLVCEIADLEPSRKGYPKTYVRRALWQIESEFAMDPRKVVFDFNKLVIRNAPYKLLIASDRPASELFLENLHPIALACKRSKVYAALLRHPSEWEFGEDRVSFCGLTEHGGLYRPNVSCFAGTILIVLSRV